MSSSGTPVAPEDPDRLREEIVRTRAALGDTVGALAAKADVQGRAKQAAADAVDDAKQRIGAAAEQTRQAVSDAASAVADKTGAAAGVVAAKAGTAASVVAETTGAAVMSVRKTVRRADLPAGARRPLPWAMIAAALVVAGVVLYVVRRRRA